MTAVAGWYCCSDRDRVAGWFSVRVFGNEDSRSYWENPVDGFGIRFPRRARQSTATDRCRDTRSRPYRRIYSRRRGIRDRRPEDTRGKNGKKNFENTANLFFPIPLNKHCFAVFNFYKLFSIAKSHFRHDFLSSLHFIVNIDLEINHFFWQFSNRILRFFNHEMPKYSTEISFLIHSRFFRSNRDYDLCENSFLFSFSNSFILVKRTSVAFRCWFLYADDALWQEAFWKPPGTSNNWSFQWIHTSIVVK